MDQLCRKISACIYSASIWVFKSIISAKCISHLLYRKYSDCTCSTYMITQLTLINMTTQLTLINVSISTFDISKTVWLHMFSFHMIIQSHNLFKVSFTCHTEINLIAHAQFLDGFSTQTNRYIPFHTCHTENFESCMF